MIIFQRLNRLDVICMRVVVRMHDLPCSHIVVSDDEIVACRVQIVVLVLKRVDSLLVVVELSQVEFLLHVHHLNSTSFVSHCEHIAVFSDRESRYILSELVDFSDGLLLNSVNDFKVSALTDQDHVFIIVI